MLIPKVWGQPQVTYQTNAYGGTDADLSNTETDLATIDFVKNGSGDVNAQKLHGVAVKVKVNSSGTTDSFDVNLYTSDDGSEWDTVALSDSFSITATSGNDVIKSVKLDAMARHLKVTGASDGAADTFDVECTITPWAYGECVI